MNLKFYEYPKTCDRCGEFELGVRLHFKRPENLCRNCFNELHEAMRTLGPMVPEDWNAKRRDG